MGGYSAAYSGALNYYLGWLAGEAEFGFDEHLDGLKEGVYYSNGSSLHDTTLHCIVRVLCDTWRP